jgi:hypothetical protein
VQINVVAIDVFQTLQRPACLRKLVGSNAEIDIAVWAKTGVRIKAPDGPTLDEHRFEALGAQQREYVSNLAFVNQRRQSKAAVNLTELVTGCGVCQRRITYAPPGECGGAGFAKQRQNVCQFSFREIRGGDYRLTRAARVGTPVRRLRGLSPGARE